MNRSWTLLGTTLALACSADAVDLGDGALPAAGSAASPKAACVSGIDCRGGECARCLLETCLCDSSEDVAIRGCVADQASLAGPPLSSGDGTALVFMLCWNVENPSPGLCRAYHWTEAFGVQQLPVDVGANEVIAGISADGRQILLGDAVDLSLPSVLWPVSRAHIARVLRYDPERNAGHFISTGLLSAYAQWQPSGVLVGLSSDGTRPLQLSRWSEQRGLEVLSDVDGLVPSVASADGSVIVGNRLQWLFDSLHPEQVVGFQTGPLFRWGERDGLDLDFGATIVGGRSAVAGALSADGFTLAGSIGEPAGIYRWTKADGLAEMAGQLAYDSPVLLSDDGSVLFGLVEPAEDLSQLFGPPQVTVPFVWTRELGFLQSAPVALVAAAPFFMLADGSMVLGKSYGWSLGGHRHLPRQPRRVQLDGGQYGGITSLSHDGNVAAGTAFCGGANAVVMLHLLHETDPSYPL